MDVIGGVHGERIRIENIHIHFSSHTTPDLTFIIPTFKTLACQVVLLQNSPYEFTL